MGYFKTFNLKKIKTIDLNNYSEMIMLGAIFLYAFTRFIDPSVNKIGQVFLGLGLFYLFIKNPDNIRKDPMFILFLSVIGAQIATWLSVKLFYPEITNNPLKIDKLGKLFLFIPIAWWLKNNRKLIPVIFFVTLAGFMIGMFISCNFVAEMNAAFKGARVDFGIRNAQHVSMFFGLIVLFSLFFMSILKKKWIVGLTGLVFLMALIGLIVTQTRQTFLSLIISFFVFSIVALVKSKISIKKIGVFSLLFILIIVVSGYSLGINNRYTGVWNSVKVFTEPLPDEVKSAGKKEILAHYINRQAENGAGIRLKLWLAMSPFVYHKPFLGWGSEGVPDKLKTTSLLKGGAAAGMGHVHNYHIRLIVCYGVVGFFLVNGVYIWFLISGYRIREKFPNGSAWFFISVSFVVYWITINNFEGYNAFWSGVFCHNLIIGCLYANYLGEKEKLV